MTQETKVVGKLGLIGSLGIFVCWSVAWYVVLGILGMGFITELPLLFPPFGASNSLVNLQRFHSAFDDQRTVFYTTVRTWGELNRALVEESDHPLLGLSKKGILEIPQDSFVSLEENARLQWVMKNSAMNPTFQAWVSKLTGSGPLPDFYGFPLVPIGSEELLSRHFPLLRRSAPLQTMHRDAKISRGSMREAIRDMGEIQERFSYPLIWRIEKFQEEYEWKKRGLLIYLVLLVFGAFISLYLMNTVVRNPLLPLLMRLIGGGFGLFALAFLSIRSHATCYMPSPETDDKKVDRQTLEVIRKDCKRYLDDLQREEKLPADKKEALLELLNRQ